MSINKAIVVGNLGRDPEVRALPSGQNVANFSVATKARFKETASRRNAPNGTAWSLSASSRVTTSACLPMDAKYSSRTAAHARVGEQWTKRPACRGVASRVQFLGPSGETWGGAVDERAFRRAETLV